jgi:hypothetical protein
MAGYAHESLKALGWTAIDLFSGPGQTTVASSFPPFLDWIHYFNLEHLVGV